MKSLPGIHFAPHWTPMTASRSMGKKGTNKPTISNRQSVWYENGLCQNTKGNFTINQKSNALIIIHKPPAIALQMSRSQYSPSSLRETWMMQGSFVERSHAVNGLHVSCSKTSHINATIPWSRKGKNKHKKSYSPRLETTTLMSMPGLWVRTTKVNFTVNQKSNALKHHSYNNGYFLWLLDCHCMQLPQENTRGSMVPTWTRGPCCGPRAQSPHMIVVLVMASDFPGE